MKRVQIIYISIALSIIMLLGVTFLFSNHSIKVTGEDDTQEYPDSNDAKPNLTNLTIKQQTPEQPKTEQTPNSGKPVLKGLGVEFAPWDGSSSSAGDFIFSNSVLYKDQNINNEKVLLEFGVREHSINNPTQNIEYWYFLKSGTKIKSVIGGKVRLAYIEHTKDWSVNVDAGSGWTVSFEHLLNLNVKEGDVVKPGDVLGEAVPWSASSKVGFTELAVWKGGSNGIYKYCPFDFLDESLKPDYEQKIKRLASDWESFTGKDVYKQESWVSPACVVDAIKEA